MKTTMLSAACAAFAVFGTTGAACAQEVYVGTGNGREAMLAHPEQWNYVRQNADGFYVNFIQMLKMDKEKCGKMADLFTHKNAFFESDSRDKGLGGFPDGGQFSRALQAEELNHLLEGGFNVKYASLNYGVGAEKKADLQRIGMKNRKLRPVLAQFGPWNFGGDITGNEGKDNERTRSLILQTDGGVTDGPIGFWQSDQNGMRGGSLSLVKFCHALHKKAVVMVCPYGAGNKNYDFGQWLSEMQKCVRDHEDAGAKPDVWAVFEYATNVPALPETVDNKPANTTTGAAYWLLHHLRDPKHDAQITATEAVGERDTNRRVINLTVRNRSDWLDLCPVLRVRLNDGDAKNGTLHFVVGGKDIPQSENGLPFIRDLRLMPGASRRVQIVWEGKANHNAAPAELRVELYPNPSNQREITQTQTVRFSGAQTAALTVSPNAPAAKGFD